MDASKSTRWVLTSSKMKSCKQSGSGRSSSGPLQGIVLPPRDFTRQMHVVDNSCMSSGMEHAQEKVGKLMRMAPGRPRTPRLPHAIQPDVDIESHYYTKGTLKRCPTTLASAGRYCTRKTVMHQQYGDIGGPSLSGPECVVNQKFTCLSCLVVILHDPRTP